MSQDELFINGELLRLRREERGWVLNDMATRACMSVKQIRQLEEGGISAFYSVAVKVTAAKKVAALVGLSTDEVFAKTPSPEVETSVHEVVASEQVAVPEEVAIPANEVVSHEVAESAAAAQPEVKAAVSVDAPTEDVATKSKTSLLPIAVLFAVALAAAAYLQPKEDSSIEAAPPVQVLPNDATDPASAASAGESVASGVEVATPASAASATSVSVAPVVAASVPRVAAPVASASMVTRPASAAVLVPATSAASKAP